MALACRGMLRSVLRAPVLRPRATKGQPARACAATLRHKRCLHVLGIETRWVGSSLSTVQLQATDASSVCSCDDTGVSIIDDSKEGAAAVIADVVSSQFEVHSPYAGAALTVRAASSSPRTYALGTVHIISSGVVPKLAARSHAANMPHVLERALDVR